MQKLWARLSLVGAISLVGGSLAVLSSSACTGDDPVFTASDDAAVVAPDAARPDPVPSVDAAPEAASSFCSTAGHHDLCADFEGINAIDMVGFTQSEVAGSGTAPFLVTDAGTPLPTGAMKASLERTPSPDGYHAARWTLQGLYDPTSTQRVPVKIAFDIFVERADPTGAPVYVMFLGSPNLQFTLTQADAGTDLAVTTVRNAPGDGGGVVTDVIAPTVPVGKWTRISVAVAARAGSPSAAGVTLSVGAQGKTYQLEPQALSTTFRGDVGLGTTNGAGAAWTVYYDNVTIDWK